MRSTVPRNYTSNTCGIGTVQILLTDSERISAKMDYAFFERDEREDGRVGKLLNSAATDCDLWSLGGSISWSRIPDAYDVLSNVRFNGNMVVSCMGVYGPCAHVLSLTTFVGDRGCYHYNKTPKNSITIVITALHRAFARTSGHAVSQAKFVQSEGHSFGSGTRGGYTRHYHDPQYASEGSVSTKQRYQSCLR
jgi:hypothetical protein